MKTFSTSLFGAALSLALMTMTPFISPANAQHDHSHDTAAVAAQEPVYSCPMHPDVTGAKGDKCSKCGMALTVPVPMYACPMHPEITGAKGDKCSKCGMALTEMKAATYACPMHPEATGKQGDKCPKCGMDMKPTKAK